MKFNPFGKPDLIPAFWQWFTRNAHQYENLKDDPQLDEKINLASHQLRQVDKRLVCEFSAHQTETHEFIISADGDRDAFPVVEKLVAEAPEIPHWKIIAFRQRGGADCTIQIHDIELGPENVWFQLEVDRDKVGISLYFGGLELDDSVAHAAFILLDNALGELDMETKVGFIERHQLRPEDDVSRLKTFEQLPEAFDAFWAMTQK